MKKILHIQVLPKLSGVQNISYEILKKIPDSEYNKTILFSSDGSKEQIELIQETFSDIGCKVLFSKNIVRELNPKKDLLACNEIRKLCKEEKFDIVHTNSSKAGVVGRIGAYIAGVPLVIHTVHGTAWNKFVKFPKWQIYWIFEMIASIFCHKIVLVNKYYKKYFFLFKKKVTTIYNAIDYKKFNDLKPLKKTDAFINILFVGRLDTPKNPLGLLVAAKKVIEKKSNVKFTLVGDGEFYDQCKNYIKENNLEKNISLVGWQTNPGEFYAKADIFVCFSIYEAFGLMFLEAGYFHLPICATNVEGIPEVVIDGETGFLCNPNDENAMANNILKLCDNKQLRHQMGEASYKRATEVFSVENMVKSYNSIYNAN